MRSGPLIVSGAETAGPTSGGCPLRGRSAEGRWDAGNRRRSRRARSARAQPPNPENPFEKLKIALRAAALSNAECGRRSARGMSEVTGQSVDAMASLIAFASLSRSDLSRSGDSALRVQPSPA